MELISLYFIVFVLISCLIYYLVPKKFQWVILLVSSIVFVVMSSGRLTAYMFATTIIAYIGALWIDKHADAFEKKKKTIDKAHRKEAKNKLKKAQKRRVIFINILILSFIAILKYCNLGVEIADFFANIFHAGVIFDKFNIILPIGISYYTLMAVSYVTDVYRGTIKSEKNPLKVLLFIIYFPHITEGPFDRYKDLSAQFNTPHKFNYDSFCKGLILVIYGFFKKMVVADRIGIVVSEVFGNTNKYCGPTIVFATAMYTIQLYCDFSGCIDIVTGVSNLFSIKIAENFRQPFFSKSIIEFWRRWHISLGLWLKDYVYFPVALSGRFKSVNKFAKKHLKSQYAVTLVPIAYSLFFVWFTNGLWHGASVKYILYGLYYYSLMMLGEILKPIFDIIKNKFSIRENSKTFVAFQMLRTFIIVNIGMLLFRSNTVGEFGHLLIKMATSFNYYIGAKDIYVISANESVHIWIPIIGVTVVLVLSLLREYKKYDSVENIIWSIPIVLREIIITSTVIFIILFGVYGPGFEASDFFYAQF